MNLQIDILFEKFNNDKTVTILLADGIAYPINASTIVRNGAILGLNALFFSPINKKIYLDNHTMNPEKYLESFKLQNTDSDDTEIVYTNKFIKNIKRYSTDHQKCINIVYNISALYLIKKAIDNGFKIFMLENDVDGDIYTKKMDMPKVLLIVGNERFGVSDDIRNMKNIEPLYIPSCVDNSSMNVANAATIGIYERSRQRNCIPSKCEGKLILNLNKKMLE